MKEEIKSVFIRGDLDKTGTRTMYIRVFDLMKDLREKLKGEEITGIVFNLNEPNIGLILADKEQK